MEDLAGILIMCALGFLATGAFVFCMVQFVIRGMTGFRNWWQEPQQRQSAQFRPVPPPVPPPVQRPGPRFLP